MSSEETFNELEHCARCDKTHHRLVFKKLTQSVLDEKGGIVYDYWAACPTNGEPILMKVLARGPDNKYQFMEPIEVKKEEPPAEPPPPVDRTAVTTLHGTPVEQIREDHAKQSTGMHSDYIVLTDEERAKGFVRPVRRAYQHVGIPGPKYPLRDLTPEEHERYDKYNYVKFEKYPEEDSANGRFWTQKELDTIGKGCGTVTSMGLALSETYARDPHFYGATFCCGCNTHLPVGEGGEFVWDGTNNRVGT